MNTKIICIIGPSGSGKTLLVNHIEKILNIPAIVSYTTRPKRVHEVNGREHWFVDEKDVPDPSEMLAYTLFGGHHYWTLYKDATKHPVILYVIDEWGYMKLLNYKTQFDIKSVLVKRSKESLANLIDSDRIKRDADRLEMNEDLFDAVIDNNGTIAEFLKNGIETIKKLAL